MGNKETKSENVEFDIKVHVVKTKAVKTIINATGKWLNENKDEKMWRDYELFKIGKPVSSNYLIETKLMSGKAEIVEVFDGQKFSKTTFEKHISLPNLTDEHKIGLSINQLDYLKDLQKKLAEIVVESKSTNKETLSNEKQ